MADDAVLQSIEGQRATYKRISKGLEAGWPEAARVALDIARIIKDLNDDLVSVDLSPRERESTGHVVRTLSVMYKDTGSMARSTDETNDEVALDELAGSIADLVANHRKSVRGPR